jgi:hypothetical protein
MVEMEVVDLILAVVAVVLLLLEVAHQVEQEQLTI